MKTLHFEGASDDTFGEYNTFNVDHDNCASGNPIEFVVSSARDGSMLVFGQYCPESASGWMVGVARHNPDDDTELPKWPMRVERGSRSYTPRLVIEAPDDVQIRCVQQGDDDAN